MKTVGIIGSGIVAQTLGAGFVKHGYNVILGTRNPDKLAEWMADKGDNAEVASMGETAKSSDLLVLAVKGTAAHSAMSLLDAEDIKGKTIMDATNPIADSPPVEGVLRFFTDQNDSLMEQLQSAFPEANFVKAFSSVGSGRMVNPTFELTPSMFICGNSAEAKAEAGEIIELFGWEVLDMGGAIAARAIEPLCMLYCIPGFVHGQWTHGFKVLK